MPQTLTAVDSRHGLSCRFAFMLGKALVAIILGALLLGPSMAEAQVCFASESASLDVGLERVGMTGAEGVARWDGEGMPPRGATDNVLWCRGADDPRCAPASPMPEGVWTPTLGLTACLLGDTMAVRPAGLHATISDRTECAAALAGCRFRVDRPPRG